MPITKSTAARAIAMLRDGPPELHQHAPTISGVSDDDAECVRTEIRGAYRRWLESFIVPELQKLVPEARA